MHLAGFITRIYHDALSHERQIIVKFLVPILPTMNETKYNGQGWQSHRHTTVTARLAGLQFRTSADQLD